jgi:peptidyl-prolyl cis-trans isomerase SurA
MKKEVICFSLFFCVLSIFSQKKKEVLVTINKEKITINEFKRVYEKNLDAIEDEKAKDVKDNLDLYINYKLKVADAYQIKLDTLSSYKREMETYKNQLIAPYLQDTLFLKQLIKETYYRLVNELNVAHILVKLEENASPIDTLAAYDKILEARDRILKGISFQEVAKEVSEDPSAKENGGDLGYFGAFRMVYPFEDTAFKTEVGEISMPFRTDYGYHIIQVNDTRKSLGEVEVAHIFIDETGNAGKLKIDSIYTKLKAGESFVALAKTYSKDSGSRDNGGKLQKFGSGSMAKPFEDVAFSLEKEGDYHQPIETRFGWHIIKLVKKYPMQSFEDMKVGIEDQLRRSGRAKLSDDAVINRLKKEYKITESPTIKDFLNKSNIRSIPKDSLQETLLTINNKKIKQESFINFINNRRQYAVPKLFEMFKDEEIKEYFKENLVFTEPEYAATLKEYQDGLLLFELMQEKIWKKSSEDTLALQNYFEQNISKFDVKNLDDAKGKVINKYQDYLDQQWIADLKAKNKIKINKKALRKLIGYYEKKK